MIVNIDGDINRFYVQTLCMVFFPGAKFAEDEKPDEKTPIVDVYLRENDGLYYAKVSITLGETKIECEHTEPYSENNIRIKTEKVAVGVALFKCGEKLFHATPAWGILTGVRPAKIARDLYSRGLSITEMKNVLTKQYFVNPKKATLVGRIARVENKIIKALPQNTCSLYISIPFCPSRCSYCSFVSYSTQKLLSLIPEYMDKLCYEVEHTLKLIKELGQTPVTVYVGGGTPTTLNCEQMTRLLSVICDNADMSTVKEFTYEMGRPDTITKEKLDIAASFGVNRISINPQTLNQSVLDAIGRKHTVKQFFKAYDIAKASNINCINTDIIAGLPGESVESFQNTVDRILELNPENITYHTFCVKKAADILKDDRDVYNPFNKMVGKCIDYAQVRAKNSGYIPYYMYRQKNTVGNYENVGYAMPGFEGLYNVYMMEEIHSVFACGAGSVTKLVSPDRATLKRVFMPKYPYEYLSDKISEKSLEDNYNLYRKFYEENFGQED